MSILQNIFLELISDKTFLCVCVYLFVLCSVSSAVRDKGKFAEILSCCCFFFPLTLSFPNKCLSSVRINLMGNFGKKKTVRKLLYN